MVNYGVLSVIYKYVRAITDKEVKSFYGTTVIGGGGPRNGRIFSNVVALLMMMNAIWTFLLIIIGTYGVD